MWLGILFAVTNLHLGTCVLDVTTRSTCKANMADAVNKLLDQTKKN